MQCDAYTTTAPVPVYIHPPIRLNRTPLPPWHALRAAGPGSAFPGRAHRHRRRLLLRRKAEKIRSITSFTALDPFKDPSAYLVCCCIHPSIHPSIHPLARCLEVRSCPPMHSPPLLLPLLCLACAVSFDRSSNTHIRMYVSSVCRAPFRRPGKHQEREREMTGA